MRFSLGLFKNIEMLKRSVALLVFDCLFIWASMIMALWIRMDFHFSEIDPLFMETLGRYGWINMGCTVVIYFVCRLYTSLWRFAGITELLYVIGASLLSTISMEAGMWLMGLTMPRSFPFLYISWLLTLTILSRFSYRFLRIQRHKLVNYRAEEPLVTMIVGAGSAGYTLAREMKNSKHLNRKVACAIDDDPAKIGNYLNGIPIVGNTSEIPIYVDKYGIQEIVIAIPSLEDDERKELIGQCQRTGCKVRALPALFQLVNEEVNVSMLRDIQIEDLLGRKPVDLKLHEIMDYVSGRTLLVTGGGGSIGSEICRQLVLHEPKLLIIFDIYENNAYDIQNEIRASHPEANVLTLIGSVRDKDRVDEIFETYHPDLVFHAAAHKHVPLMEDSPNEAIKNNVLGTYNVASAADRFGTGRMVLISTDKAVRPTNVMGASKRACELIVQAIAQNSKTVFAAVRFGNVLGSNGSVIPLFTRQIMNGGPVTVTHPEIIRYFMTIPEAVSLVLQCGALAQGGEIFILDMGKPVKILDLAENMIRLSGYVPYEDIDIVFTGLRPGEKLYEELLIAEANLKETPRKGIFVANQTSVNEKDIFRLMKRLVDDANANASAQDIREDIQAMVPEYTIWKAGMQGE